MIYIAVSGGRAFYAAIIRFVTTLLLRREALEVMGYGPIKAYIYLWASLFNLGPAAYIASEFNHCFITYWCDCIRMWTAIEIDHFGVRELPLRHALKRTKYVRYFATAEPQTNLFDGVRANVDRIGRRYDWLGVFFALLFILLYVTTGLSPRKLLHSSRRDFCSEYVATVINDTPGLADIGKPSEVYPEYLYLHMMESDDYRIVKGPPVKL
jgi:hypothetical protein